MQNTEKHKSVHFWWGILECEKYAPRKHTPLCPDFARPIILHPPRNILWRYVCALEMAFWKETSDKDFMENLNIPSHGFYHAPAPYR